MKKLIDEQIARLLEVVFIFLGISLRTAGPAIQKLLKAFNEKSKFVFEWRWIGSAISAFFASWYLIVMMVPVEFDTISRLIIAFGIAYFGNGVINDYIMKLTPLKNFLERGNKKKVIAPVKPSR